MPAPPRLHRIIGFGEPVDSDLAEWVSAIERALNVTAAAPLRVTVGPQGIAFALDVPRAAMGVRYARAATGGIGPATSGTVGEGLVTLQRRYITTLSDEPGSPEKCYNHFAVSIPAGRRVVVAMAVDGAWTLVGADCPP